MGFAEDFKRGQMQEMAAFRDELRRKPLLRWIFFEMTDQCNLACRHCGSSCLKNNSRMLNLSDAQKVIDSATAVYPKDSFTVCLTGGEPLLHPEFFRFARYVRNAGLMWGMTTNATLIDEACAEELRESGMKTVTVSLDGTAEDHDWLRGQVGAHDRVVMGIRALQKAGYSVQATSVIHQKNFGKLEEIYSHMKELGISSWRPINMEPIGRALLHEDLLLRDDQIVQLLEFIQEKRFDDREMEVTFGCSHYLTPRYEHMVRNQYFMCHAGVQVASVTADGDIIGCLDIERRPELVQGNIAADDFADVWEHRFKIFRTDRTANCEGCLECQDRDICGGDSMHTWSFEENRPLLCLRKAIIGEK